MAPRHHVAKKARRKRVAKNANTEPRWGIQLYAFSYLFMIDHVNCTKRMGFATPEGDHTPIVCRI